MVGIVLTTERFSLRPATEADLDGVKQIVADPDVTKMLLGDVSTPEGTDKEARKWIDDEAFWQKNGFGSWGVFDQTGDLVGIAAASPALAGLGEGPEIFYFIKRDCWGMGVAFETVRRMCRYLFDDVRAAALEASIYAELNPGSVRLAEKLGMRAAGRVTLREHGLGDERIEEVVRFDLWRVRVAPAERLNSVLAEAAFRIGQTLAENLSSPQARRAALLDQLRARGHIEISAAELVDLKLAEGAEAKGLALYRMHRHEFTG